MIMKFAIILKVFLILTYVCLPPVSAYSSRRDGGGGGDGVAEECLKSAVRVVANENTDNIGDFHEKSDMEKLKTLYKETERMMENGNNAWKTLTRTPKILQEEFGGEETFLNNHFTNYTTEFSKGTLDSGKICKALRKFEDYYKKAKESIGTTIGASDTFWPMVKDMMTSVDLEHTDIKEAPTVFYGSAAIIAFGQSDETIDSFASMVNMFPEELLRQTIRRTGITSKPFPFT